MSHRRVALVTGANRGLGLEVCRQLCRSGWTVALGARDLEKGTLAAETVDAGAGEVLPVELDVRSAHQPAQTVASVVERYGRLDALVNNAGINYDVGQRAAEADLDDVIATFETNLFGAWRLAVAAAPHLRASRGRIVNVSSGAGAIDGMGAGTPAYSTSKAALNVLTIKLAAELRSDGVLVNAVCPGWVATDMGGGGGRPIDEGARGIVWAVELDDDGPTGGFFRDGRLIPW